jgi:peptidoglycan/LPS O-acetylase OafA/YrhL
MTRTLSPLGASMGDAMDGRENHFNLLRILLAAGVLLSHCFPLTAGHGNFAGEPWFELTQGMRQLGSTCVLGFFVISGYLVSQSFERSPSLLVYLRARLLRIYPAAIACAIVSALFLGPLVTSLDARDYFGSHELWRFLAKTTTFLELKHGGRSLPGAFPDNPVTGNMNGSLWTISWELLCYVVLIPCGLLLYRQRSRFGRTAAWTLLVVLAIAGSAQQAWRVLPNNLVAGFLAFWGFFAIGILGRALLARIPSHPLATLGAAAAFVLIARYERGVPLLGIASPALLGYVLLTAATQLPRSWLAYNRLGDFSYGLYLYAWPAQQTLLLLFPQLTAWMLFPAALVAALVPAVLSWRLIERPALRLKQRTNRARPAMPVAEAA